MLPPNEQTEPSKRPAEDLSLQRKLIRRELLRARAGLTDSERQEKSELITDRLLREFADRQVGQEGSLVVALYWPIKNEPNLLAALQCNYPQALSQWNIDWALPAIVNSVLEFRRIDLLQLEKQTAPGAYGIPEPRANVPTKPDFIVCPCVGFSRAGLRLGYGGGYYDRTLQQWQGTLIGVAYASAERQDLRAASWDRPLDLILTETETIKPLYD